MLLPALGIAAIAAMAAPPRAARRDAAFAIMHANVIPMDSERVLRDHTIVVTGNRIAAVAPDGAIALPEGTPMIDAGGAYVTPGLIDSHVHIRRSELDDYVHAGITSVRNMWGYQALPATMRLIEDGTLLGPTIYSASQGIDASPGVWPETQFVDEPSQADAVVAAQVAAGWRFLKVYNSLSLESYDAIVASAQARGIRFAGHVSNQVPIEHALDSGQASIEHLRGYDFALQRNPGGAAAWANVDVSLLPALAAHTAAAGTWNCPTIAVFDVLLRNVDAPTRERAIANRAAVIQGLHQAGARLLAGTDSGIDLAVPGASIHVELAGLVAAGLSPYEALRAATSGGAEFLEAAAEIGTIAAGRRADLLLVESNPLEDLAALRSIRTVILRGSWIPLDGSRVPLLPRVPQRTVSPRDLQRPRPR